MRIIGVGIIVILLDACQENEAVKDDFTGNELVYTLEAGSVYPVNGTAILKERKDGYTTVIIEVSGTEGNIEHPVHLHLGDISAPGAEVTALLNPVIGKTGKSETTLAVLADESPVTYTALTKLNACIKIHLSSSGPDRDIILAGGNIGSASAARTNGSVEMGICKSE